MPTITTTELKRKYEAGEKLNKAQQKRVKEQLKRKCKFPRCNETLAFTKKRDFCSKEHTNRYKSTMRKLNAEKKRRWEAKHGIVRKKTIKRNIKDSRGIPAEDEFKEHYSYRYYSAIRYQHGTFAKAVKKACKTTRNELRHPDKQALLEALMQFFENHGRVPQTSDFNRGLLRDRGVYTREFGSLNNARVEAGLNALLPIPHSQPIELTPEQYAEYKETGVVKELYRPSKEALRLRTARRVRKMARIA